MDKMASVEDAANFLNDLKAVFGVRGVLFLVAVSEDALETFDRRALGVRTAFDTAFDAIVRVDPLDVTEARRRRIGAEWACLSHFCGYARP